MGALISAVISKLTGKGGSKSGDNLNESQGNEKDATKTTTMQQVAANRATIPKRKSKPELSVHRPTAGQGSQSKLDLVVHEFTWKYGGKEVLLAGEFTDWQPSIPMVPNDADNEYWKALVELDPRRSWQFKFVVDGVWRCGLDLPTSTDYVGNTNNIIHPEA